MPAQLYPPSPDDLWPVSVSGESLRIPYRLYLKPPTPDAADALDETQRLILACLLSRHHDGFVRHRNVPQLLMADADWVPPFVVQLAAEYVVEIIELILERVDDLSPDRYRRFAADNPRFMALTRQRVVSYWNAYYRSRFPRLADYPGFRTLAELGLWIPANQY